ncbi:hypothetical protein F7R28_15825 [Polaromonas sp. Pch-P]|nr:hypothetical protein F7R28_15825 [Polaromonas sp. Pch-P]
MKIPTAGATLPQTLRFHNLRFLMAARNTVMKLLAMAVMALAGQGAFSADTWLTITGDPGNSGNHYIQVNPAAIDIKDDLRVIPVRINRAKIWTTNEGVQFRSVETEVQIDCTQQTARYVKASFYAHPDFRGQPFKVAVYAPDDIRPMVFKDIADNPNVRIIKAACMAKGATNN